MKNYQIKISQTLILVLFFTFIFSSSKAQNVNVDTFQVQIQKKLDSLYDETTDFGGITLGVVLPDGQKASFAVGYADIANKIRMKPSDRMLGGSTGKIFVSASIMQLVEKGKLKLDDNVSIYLGHLDWYSSVQNHNKLTLRHLLQHASGISRYVFEPSFQEEIHQDPDRIWKPSELIGYVLNKEPLFEAGTDFAYSDTNYIILAMILEKVSNMSMYDYVEKNILKPFNLNDISPQINRKIEGLVVGYNRDNDEFFPGVVVDKGIYKFNVQFEWAGGGFVMNTTDLAMAGKLIYEAKVFDVSLMEEFLNGIEAKGLGGKWGLGVHISETPFGTTYGHSGFFPGYITNMLYFPEHKFSVAFQINTSDGQKISLYRKVYQVIPSIIDYLNKKD